MTIDEEDDWEHDQEEFDKALKELDETLGIKIERIRR